MHDALRNRLLRKLESLPEPQLYQVLDFIEFLDEKYGPPEEREVSNLQRFAERLEDGLRRRTVSPGGIREAFQLLSTADRVLGGVSEAGRRILEDGGEPRGDPPRTDGRSSEPREPREGPETGLTPDSGAE